MEWLHLISFKLGIKAKSVATTMRTAFYNGVISCAKGFVMSFQVQDIKLYVVVMKSWAKM